MTKIENIKSKLNSVEKLNLNDDNASTIKDIVLVLAGIDNSIQESECVEFLDSENAWKELEKYVDERVKISKRILNTFENMNDMNEFMKNNECGEYWYDADITNSKYYVYSY